MKMNISKQELSNIMHLAWPAVVQEAMSVVVSYVDTAMVGALGASASAAIGLTGTVNWLTMSICLGFGPKIAILAVSHPVRYPCTSSFCLGFQLSDCVH